MFSGIEKINTVIKNPYKKLGISWMDIRKLKNIKNKVYKQRFLNGHIQFYNPLEFLHGLNEIFINEIYKITLRDGAKIIDCGGHIGLSTIYLKKNHPNSRIIVFEPDEKNFTLLQRNVLSQSFKNIELRNEAVWIKNTKLKFKTEGTMSSKITNNDNFLSTVTAIKLYDFLFEKTDFLKLDIEGAEYSVLLDISDKLHLVTNMFLEYHGTFDEIHKLTQIFNIINNAGFKYYIKEANEIFPHPLYRGCRKETEYDIQLNIFCFRD